MNWQTPLQGILFISGATILLLIAARFINQFVMSVRLTESLVLKDNPAIGVQITGYIMGVMLIISSVLTGEGSGNLLTDARDVALYGVTGIIILAVISSLLLRLFLTTDAHEAVRQGNVSVGITAAGSYIAVALVVAACVSGDARGGNFLTAIIFMATGFVALLAITFVFRRLTAYDDVQEILGGNIPAAMSYAGLMIAVGIIVGHAVKGDFVNYLTSFTGFGKTLLAVIALYPIRQFLVQGLLLGSGFHLYGGRLDTEISHDRNVNAGILEAVGYISAALLITHVS